MRLWIFEENSENGVMRIGNFKVIYHASLSCHAGHPPSSGSDTRTCRFAIAFRGTRQLRGTQRMLADVRGIARLGRGVLENVYTVAVRVRAIPRIDVR
jgi:hypothetical protein